MSEKIYYFFSEFVFSLSRPPISDALLIAEGIWGEAKEQGQALWESVSKFFEHLLPDEDKVWEEVDETIEGKE